MDGEKRPPIRSHASAGVVVHVLPGATAQHLRDMAAILRREADEMEGKK
ncbi:MAG TPA: hypothetical protein VGN96_11015 [Roseococcus sp.]|jgi:hypothetical protein|nr:hypothetical protein [Roseococcus sp.]